MFLVKLLFNKFFQSITKNLDLFEWPDELKFNIFDEIDIIINSVYQIHLKKWKENKKRLLT